MKYLFLLLLLLLSPLLHATAFAQTSTTPSVFFCVGNSPQPPCVTVAPSLSPTFGTSIIPSEATASPTSIINTTPLPPTRSPIQTTNPCITQQSVTTQSIDTASIQDFHEKKHQSMQQGLLQQLFQLLLELLQFLFQQLDIHVPKTTPCPQPTSGITPTMGVSPTSGATPAIVTPSIIPTPTVFGISPAPSISPTSTTLPTGTITPNGKVPFFVHYYIWWDSSHWKSLLGNNYPYIASPLPLPATLATDGCTATPSYAGDTIIDIPESSLGLYSQDNAAVFDTHIQEAASAGINGFVVSWAGNGQSNQTPSSTAFNSRLDSLISRVAVYNASHANKFYLMIGYEGLDNSRNPRAVTWIKNDLQYFVTRYSTNAVFQIPQYGTKPVLMFLDSRKFAVSDVATITSSVRSKLLLLGDEHGTTDWNRGISSYFDGDAWYFSSQDPVKNPGGFTQIKTLASTLQSQHKLWFSPLSGGYNKSNFSLGGQCVPRNNGQTMQAIYNGNKTSHPNGWMYISWNEFLENTYVEPSLRYGNFYLQKLKNIIANP